MVTKQVIENIYKKYRNAPSSIDELDLSLLFEYAIENHGIYVDENELVIESIDPDSPFHTIDLGHINAIIEFERTIAVVLPNAIVFLNKKDSGVNVHIKATSMSFMDRIREKLSGEVHPEF